MSHLEGLVSELRRQVVRLEEERNQWRRLATDALEVMAITTHRGRTYNLDQYIAEAQALNERYRQLAAPSATMDVTSSPSPYQKPPASQPRPVRDSPQA